MYLIFNYKPISEPLVWPNSREKQLRWQFTYWSLSPILNLPKLLSSYNFFMSKVLLWYITSNFLKFCYFWIRTLHLNIYSLLLNCYYCLILKLSWCIVPTSNARFYFSFDSHHFGSLHSVCFYVPYISPPNMK